MESRPGCCAVRNAHSVLVHANRALPDANWRAGISCVALLGNELTIAQAGPALVMVSHPRTIDQYPAKPGPVGVSLGGEERPDAELYRTTVETGSMVLVAQSDWLATAPSESLAAITTTENPRLSVEYLAQLAGKADLSALLIGFASGLPSVADDGFPASDPVMVEAAAPVIASREASSQPARKPSPPPSRVEHETRPTEAATAPWMSPPAGTPGSVRSEPGSRRQRQR